MKLLLSMFAYPFIVRAFLVGILVSGAKPQATATDSAPNDTWLSPSPIIE